MTKHKFPKVIYVTWEKEKGSEGYHLIWNSVKETPENEEIAVYELKQIAIHKSKHWIE
jgi:hypothetical protein